MAPDGDKPAGLPLRTLFPLSAAAFCSAATVRVADPLIPQISEEFAVPISDAAIIATAFTLSYGLFQIVYGRFGDRAGKVTVIAFAAFVSGLGAIASAFANGLPLLALLRFAGGCTAGAIIPLAIAHVGDVTAYEQRQEVLAKFLSGQVLGIVMGQALGGIIGEHIGWRGVFAVFGLLFLVTAALLWIELAGGRVRQSRSHTAGKLLRQYQGLIALPKVRRVVGAVFIEGFLFFGAFTFVGAYLRRHYGLSLDAIGLLLASFGIGALGYIIFARHFIRRLGEHGMVLAGGSIMATAFVIIGMSPPVWAFVILLGACGMGFYLMHNTLQTNGTQMAPHARGLGMSLFATCLFVGQSIGITLAGRLVERIGFEPTIIGYGLAIAVLGVALSRHLNSARD
jgi:MFS transporter, YNFM family, putative membrane transport protein